MMIGVHVPSTDGLNLYYNTQFFNMLSQQTD